MNAVTGDDVHHSSFIVHRWAAILALFLIPRLTLLFTRDLFFDELFTRWIAGKSFAGIVEALRFDSGPPLYYFLIHALGNPPLVFVRSLSLLFATVSIGAILAAQRLGPARFTAAALLAVFPPAVLFAVDARAYALCAMLVTLGVLATVNERPFAAAIAFLLAAYSHYYGALFFPLLASRWRALLVAVVLFVPGFWLAVHQPAGARGWMTLEWPNALFAPPPVALMVIASLVALAAAFRVNRFTVMTLVPYAAALALGVYVPLRFEAIVTTPLALWLGESLQSWKASARRVLTAALLLCGAAWTTLGILDHATRPVDDYRAAATFVATQVPHDAPVVASGYLFLETIAQRPAIAFPPEQALHPGWRATATPGSSLPPGGFIWIGERAAPELALIRRSRRVTPLYLNARAAVVKVN
jgi:hypothetical protein